MYSNAAQDTFVTSFIHDSENLSDCTSGYVCIYVDVGIYLGSQSQDGWYNFKIFDLIWVWSVVWPPQIRYFHHCHQKKLCSTVSTCLHTYALHYMFNVPQNELLHFQRKTTNL